MILKIRTVKQQWTELQEFQKCDGVLQHHGLYNIRIMSQMAHYSNFLYSP